MRFELRHVLGILALAAAVALSQSGCRRAPAQAVSTPSTPTVRLYVISTAAGALEPCGCTKDMLGGVDHVAAFIAGEAKEAPHSLVVGAGPMLFMEPRVEGQKAAQDLWKAEALAQAFGDIGLSAWAPGANDWAAGEGELVKLAKSSKASLLAGNLKGAAGGASPVRVVETNGYRVGLAGVSDPAAPTGAPSGLEIGDLQASLGASLAELDRQGARIKVALVAAERGRALRLAERVKGFHVMVVGKPFEKGDGNDGLIPPALIEGTLVVQSPNHLQSVGVVDLFVRGALTFQDGTGIGNLEKRGSLAARIAELEARIRQWESTGAAATDVAQRKKELDALRAELIGMKEPEPPADGSFFRYRAEEMKEALGRAPAVATRMDEYYRRVNDHNKEAFKDWLPPPARPGDAKYVGVEECAGCHAEAFVFWKSTPHARAYATLQTQHKEFNLDCVSCHVTGYEKPAGSTVTHVKGLEDVQCEVCHGPGSRHVDDPTDLAALVRSPPKALCAPACHHTPHVPASWSVDLAWKVILGKGHGEKK